MQLRGPNLDPERVIFDYECRASFGVTFTEIIRLHMRFRATDIPKLHDLVAVQRCTLTWGAQKLGCACDSGQNRSNTRKPMCFYTAIVLTFRWAVPIGFIPTPACARCARLHGQPS